MVVALVAAAGAGERLGGDSPKALIELAGRPLVAWCLEALARSSTVDRLVVAAPAGKETAIATAAERAAPGPPIEVVPGGESRSGSVARALARAGDADVVVVHDAARPLVTGALVDACVEALGRWGCDGAIAATPATDTIKQADTAGRVTSTLERSGLWAVQTPQVFPAPTLRRALEGDRLDSAYDDAQLVEAMGGDVRIVEATPENLKVTTRLDLEVAEVLLRKRAS